MTNTIVPVVVVHGGAGDVAPEKWAAHVEGCARAAAAGLAILTSGGSALDAVEAAVRMLEDDPHFNAGTGACLTENGTLELDAAIMRGADLAAGAVTGLPAFRHPIAIARRALEHKRHVFYAGNGAIDFATREGFATTNKNEMITDAARARLQNVLAGKADRAWAGGTVGAVACDANGHTAAATSTGGTVAKARGRVGDSPVIGAGTYADDHAGACSATGEGEALLRIGIARTVIEAMRHGKTAPDAATHGIDVLSARVQGTGGVIVVDTEGRVGLARNTNTMSYAVARAHEKVRAGMRHEGTESQT